MSCWLVWEPPTRHQSKRARHQRIGKHETTNLQLILCRLELSRYGYDAEIVMKNENFRRNTLRLIQALLMLLFGVDARQLFLVILTSPCASDHSGPDNMLSDIMLYDIKVNQRLVYHHRVARRNKDCRTSFKSWYDGFASNLSINNIPCLMVSTIPRHVPWSLLHLVVMRRQGGAFKITTSIERRGERTRRS